MIAIRAENLGKKYEIYKKPSHRLAEMIFPRGKKRHREMWALREINFEIEKGSTCGIIGHNGAGKSTLLRLLSGLSQPTTGRIITKGKVTSVLQLGAGFRGDFTGRANLYMNCSLMGLSKEVIEDKFEEIVDFAELGDFIDLPVNTYSSGMKMRLTFSIMVALEPEILLIDEVIAVGDEYFRGKCFNKINDLKRSGTTLLIVTHSLYNLRSICDRVMLLEKGRLVANGQPDDVVDRYLNMVHAQREKKVQKINTAAKERRGAKNAPPRWGEGTIRIEGVRLLDKNGTERNVFHPGDYLTVEASYSVRETTEHPVFGIGIFRSDGTYISGINHLWHRNPLDIVELKAGTTGVVSCTIENLPLLMGSYYISYYCYDHSELAPTPIDHMEKALVFEVMEGNVIEHGMVSIATRWEIREIREEAHEPA